MSALKVAAEILYGLADTNSPAVRVSEASVAATLPVSLTLTLPLHVVTVRLITPPNVTPIPDKVGSSAP